MMPSDPAAHKRELEARRAQQQDADMRAFHGAGGAQASPTPKAPANTPARSLALDIGRDRILLPTAVTISRTFTEEGEEIATHISFGGRVTLTIAEAVREGVLDLDGRFSHYRAGIVLHRNPEPGSWVHPMGHSATQPAAGPRL
jgi:hypothetical protein